MRSPDGRYYRHLPLRNTNKKFNPVTARTMHFPVWGDVATGRVSTVENPGAVEIWPVFGDGTPAVWRWSRPKIDAQPDDLVCREVKGKLGVRADIFQLDWLHPERRKKLPTIWSAEQVGSTDTAVAELKEILAHVFESPKPTGLIRRILTTMPDDAAVLDFFAGSGTTGHAVALQNAADGGTRTCLSINSAEPTRPARTPTSPAMPRSPTSPGHVWMRSTNSFRERQRVARSSALSSLSRWLNNRCKCGTVRRQPVNPNAILSTYDVQVMLRAMPSIGIDKG